MFAKVYLVLVVLALIYLVESFQQGLFTFQIVWQESQTRTWFCLGLAPGYRGFYRPNAGFNRAGWPWRPVRPPVFPGNHFG